jgi:hypothetical protein
MAQHEDSKQQPSKRLLLLLLLLLALHESMLLAVCVCLHKQAMQGGSAMRLATRDIGVDQQDLFSCSGHMHARDHRSEGCCRLGRQNRLRGGK